MAQRDSVDSVIPSGRRETFGRYELLAAIGQGGMGRLYIAERRGIQGFVKTVALKRILPHLADSVQLREMFLNEARIAARLEHPNIVATYELGEVEGKYFISMEYLPGEDLSAVIGRCQGDRQIPIEIAAALAQQAAQGLHYAHEARDAQGRPIGLVHRDVNPRNIFVTYHGVVKLLDFGVVRGPQGQKSVPGVFKGKYGYCAPEQLHGGRVDRRTDVFCLGISLWECLTGTRLFDGANDAMAIDAVRSRRVDPPSALRANVPRGLDEIVLRALSRDPEQRYQSAQDLSEDLDRFLLERDVRPSVKAIGQWLESIFGSERAALKKAISQGGGAEGNIERLVALDGPKPATGEGSGSGSSSRPRPRAVWSTSFGMPSGSGSDVSRPSFPSGSGGEGGASPSGSPSAGPTAARLYLASSAAAARRSGPRTVLVAVAIAIGLGGAAFAWLRARGDGAQPPPVSVQTTGALDLESRPSGADVFVDGNPTGLKTPAVLKGLPVRRALEIRMDKPGYEGTTDKVALVEGQTRKVIFTLREVSGRLSLRGVPRGATAFLDDAPIDAAAPVVAPAGAHRLRVEQGASVLLSKTVDLQAGADLQVDLSRERSNP
jgi:serine/threonine protein kinase